MMLKKNLSVGLFALFILGCITSPLLDHEDAQAQGIDARTEEEKKDCPMLFEKQGLCASLEWVNKPTAGEQVNPGIFLLRFWQKAAGNAQGPYTKPTENISIRLYMPEHGHGVKNPKGMSPLTINEEKDANNVTVEGVYRVTSVYFSMSGNWDIEVYLKNEKKETVGEFKVSVHVED